MCMYENVWLPLKLLYYNSAPQHHRCGVFGFQIRAINICHPLFDLQLRVSPHSIRCVMFLCSFLDAPVYQFLCLPASSVCHPAIADRFACRLHELLLTWCSFMYVYACVYKSTYIYICMYPISCTLLITKKILNVCTSMSAASASIYLQLYVYLASLFIGFLFAGFVSFRVSRSFVALLRHTNVSEMLTSNSILLCMLGSQ